LVELTFLTVELRETRVVDEEVRIIDARLSKAQSITRSEEETKNLGERKSDCPSAAVRGQREPGQCPSRGPKLGEW
jgi:hypothetical protein